MYCTKCGKENKAEANFCTECGALFREEVNLKKEGEQLNKEANVCEKDEKALEASHEYSIGFFNTFLTVESIVHKIVMMISIFFFVSAIFDNEKNIIIFLIFIILWIMWGMEIMRKKMMLSHTIHLAKITNNTAVLVRELVKMKKEQEVK